MSLKQCLTVGVLWLGVSAQVASAQSRQPTHEEYRGIRAERTQRLSEIDGFVTEAFSPRSATPATVQAGLAGDEPK